MLRLPLGRRNGGAPAFPLIFSGFLQVTEKGHMEGGVLQSRCLMNERIAADHVRRLELRAAVQKERRLVILLSKEEKKGVGRHSGT